MTKVAPLEVITDRAAVYPTVLEELVPAAQHSTSGTATTGSSPTTADSNSASARCAASRPTPAPEP